MSGHPASLSSQSSVGETLDIGVDALVALTPTEVSQFFPENLGARLNSMVTTARWRNPQQMNPGDWHELLRTLRPKIIVSAWQTPRLPAALPALEYLCHVVGSVRGVLPRELLASGLKVTNWGGIAAPMVAEHALLLILGSLRSISQWQRFLAEPFTHVDTARMQTRSLHGRRVAIHGFGQIARELVALLKPFRVYVSAYSVGVPAALMRDHGVTPVDSLEALAAAADIFVTCEALTDRTRNSIGREVLSKLARGSVFVNVGRGAVVDEEALAEVALEREFGVASDVFATEPLPKSSSVRNLPNSLYSPHIGGPTLDRYPQCGMSAIENIERYLHGRPLVHQVTLEIFDRST